MVVHRGFLLLLFVGSMLIISLSFYHMDMSQDLLSFYQGHMSQDERAEEVNWEQELRKYRLRRRCDDDEEFARGKRSLEDKRYGDLQNLVVDEKHGLVYCYIPKVACTNWKRVLLVLNQSDPHLDPMSIAGDKVHSIRFNLLPDIPKPEREAMLKQNTKFLFVRDPFIRLISAYRNKFVKKNGVYYKGYARHILRKYGNMSDPPETMDEAMASGVQMSFYNFIQYLVDPETPPTFDPHWRPMHNLCHPCLIQYDFIGHLENLQEDADQLMKNLKLEYNVTFPLSYQNMTTSGSVSDWFGPVPLEDRRKLYEIYKEDFRLFGYRKPVELLDG